VLRNYCKWMGIYNTFNVEGPKQHTTHFQQIILYAQWNGKLRLLALLRNSRSKN